MDPASGGVHFFIEKNIFRIPKNYPGTQKLMAHIQDLTA